jgi:hypothetical protein
MQTEISRFIANSPELAGFRVRILSLQSVVWISGAGFDAFVSAPSQMSAIPLKADYREIKSKIPKTI